MIAGAWRWWTRWVTSQCWSQMSSPEWLRVETAPPRPQRTQVRETFTWPTTPISRFRQQSRNNERGESGGGEMKGKKRREGKEKGGKNRGREKVKMCHVWKPKVKNKIKLISRLDGGKIQQHIEVKAGHKERGNHTMLTRRWRRGGWVENALVWRMIWEK